MFLLHMIFKGLQRLTYKALRRQQDSASLLANPMTGSIIYRLSTTVTLTMYGLRDFVFVHLIIAQFSLYGGSMIKMQVPMEMFFKCLPSSLKTALDNPPSLLSSQN